MYRTDHTRSLLEVLVLLLCTGGGAYVFLLTLKFVLGIDLLKNDVKSRMLLGAVIVLFLAGFWGFIREHGVGQVGALAIGVENAPDVVTEDDVRRVMAVRTTGGRSPRLHARTPATEPPI